MGVTNTQRKYKDRLFVSLFREKTELLALYNAVTDCIGKGILTEYLTKHRSEVCDMILTEYNEELHNRTLREDGRAIGRKEGLREGRREGLREGHDELTRAMMYLLRSKREPELQRLAFDEEFRKQIILESK